MYEIGSNHTLNGKSIEFIRQKWLTLPVAIKFGIQAEIEGLELNKTLTAYNYLCEIGTMCPLLRGLVDTIRTESNPRPPPQSHESLPPD